MHPAPKAYTDKGCRWWFVALSECSALSRLPEHKPAQLAIWSMVGKESRSVPVSAKIVAAESWPTLAYSGAAKHFCCWLVFSEHGADVPRR
jgi:hypothetical protein